VFDIGMHIGDDTAYYLSRGSRVVAIEADPRLTLKARERFAVELDDGRLHLVEAAIADKDGTTTLWLSSGSSEWNSLREGLARRKGSDAEPVEVDARSIGSVFDEFGLPAFMKVDIEGAEEFVLRGLTKDRKPPALSIELTRADGIGLKNALWLADLGYEQFMCVDQSSHRPIERPSIWSQEQSGVAAWQRSPFALLRKLLRTNRLPSGKAWRDMLHKELAWKFNRGSSGPTGQELAAIAGSEVWMSLEEALTSWLAARQGIVKHGQGIDDSWFDLDARTLDAS